MKELNKITYYLMCVCEYYNISYKHKMLGDGCFNCFYIDLNLPLRVIEHVKNFSNKLSNKFNYHLFTEINTVFSEKNGKIEIKKKLLFAYFE